MIEPTEADHFEALCRNTFGLWYDRVELSLPRWDTVSDEERSRWQDMIRTVLDWAAVHGTDPPQPTRASNDALSVPLLTLTEIRECKGLLAELARLAGLPYQDTAGKERT